MIRAVIFDLDGTLLDRSRSLLAFISDQFDRVFGQSNVISKDRYIDRFIELDQRGYVWKDRVYQQLVEELNLPYDRDFLLKDYEQRFALHAVGFPNMNETLTKLREAGYKLGMITNGLGEFQNRSIDGLGIRGFFDRILISEMEGIRKPDPAIFLRAAELLEVSPDECVYVGDHPVNDVIASRNAGMKGIWKEDLYYSDKFDSDGVITDLMEIIDLIKRWDVS